LGNPGMIDSTHSPWSRHPRPPRCPPLHCHRSRPPNRWRCRGRRGALPAHKPGRRARFRAACGDSTREFSFSEIAPMNHFNCRTNAKRKPPSAPTLYTSVYSKKLLVSKGNNCIVTGLSS